MSFYSIIGAFYHKDLFYELSSMIMVFLNLMAFMYYDVVHPNFRD